MKCEVLFFRSSVVRLGIVVGVLGVSIEMRFRGFWIEVLALLESYV
jgi:hypothetical protein